MVSEQIGEPIGSGTHRRPSEDVTVHFDTGFNRALVFGRSALLAALAVWIFFTWGKMPISILLGSALLVVAGWLPVKDYPSLTGYRIEVAESGLYLSIPPEPEMEIPWESIEGLKLAGHGYGSAGAIRVATPFGQSRTVGVELPAWETMDIILFGGQTYTVNLEALSVEHRQIMAQALIKRADLVEEK
jgi:hypothetical protein